MVIITWKRVIIALVSLAIIIITYLLWTREERAVKRDMETYVKAMMSRDFDTIYRYHAPTQKRVAITMKSPVGLEARLKRLYEDEKASFEQAPDRLDQGVPSGIDLKSTPLWSEKSLLIKDMNYRITGVRMVEDVENPSLPIKERMNAFVEVEVEYTDRETAPDLGGRVRKVTYIIKLVHSRNVARTWIGEPKEKRWLFSGIAVKEKSLVYW